MAGYTQVASQIKRLIREQDLRPGDPLPSERQLVTQLRTTYGKIRLANNHLCRHGIIERLHGRGTFVAEAKSKKDKGPLHHRLGLLYVDSISDTPSLSPYSQALTFGIQKAALTANYELVIERMRSDDLVQGRFPEMLRRNSVDGLLLDGRVRSHHIRFLEDRGVPYIVTGNCPLDDDVPQVRYDAELMTFEITRQLLQAGRGPVWLDVDLPATDQWYMGLEMFRGYESAMRQFGGNDGALHLCPIEPKRIAEAASTLCRSGLERAAIIVQNWCGPLLASALSAHASSVEDLLIVPCPSRQYCAMFDGPNVLRWTSHYDSEAMAEQAVRKLVGALEGDPARAESLSFEVRCSNLQLALVPRMDAAFAWVPKATFSLEKLGEGKAWRRLGADGQRIRTIEKNT